ncbi:MAG: hypothetical protein GY858_03305, partial [Candidatus Omnitrophica bacterium]|nr:hypothetical protein [Candidatus Omnitrophota bacterium]
GQAAKKEREEAARASNEKKQAWESKFGEYKESDPVRWIEAYLQANRSERGDVVGVEEIIIGMTIEVAATLVGLNPIGKFYDSEAQLPDEVDQLIAGQDHSGGSVGAMLGMLGDAVAAYEEANFTEINVVGVGGFYNVVEAMRDEHRRTGKKIRAEFNGVILEFTGEESNEEMLKGFREKLDQKNKAYRDSPEGQADMRERKESANEGDQPMADRDHGDGVAGLMLNHMPSDVAAAYEANARDEDRKKNIAHQLTLLIEAKGIEITEDINASIEIAAGRMRDNQKAAGMSLPEDIKKDDLHSIVAEAANFASITGGVRDDSDEVGGIDLDYSQLGIKGGQVEFSNISPAAAEILGRGLKIGRTEIKHGENLKIWLGIKEEPELSYLSD